MTDHSEPDESLDAGADAVEVRRNAGLSAGVGAMAALLAIAFAARAFTGGSGLDWLLLALLLVITGVHLASLVDSRAPLLVADDHGVRLRSGARWRGIAWPEIDCLEHLPRRGLLRDGHLLVDGFDDQQLIVPLTLATRVVGATPATLSDVLAGLARGRADVVEVVPEIEEEPVATGTVPTLSDLYRDDEPSGPPTVERRGIAAQVAAGLSGGAATTAADDEWADPWTDEEAETGEIAQVERAEPEPELEDDGPEPTRRLATAARVEATASPRVVLAPEATPALDSNPNPISDGTEGTVVLHDLALQPAAEPVIGPDLAAARARLRLTIDQLSERTRIRPHVIEAIEVDDFAPCGGDFYARGHLRTLARVLGIDAAPLVASYDEHYAHEPVDPRRVFESELATGTSGSIRGTRGGRNWSVLIAFVMAAVLVWSVARLVMGDATPVAEKPYVLNQSGGVSAAQPGAEPVRLRLTAAGGGATLVVRDGVGKVVFDGALAFGQTTQLRLVPPVRVQTSDGSVTFAFGKDDPAALGGTGTEVARTLVPR
ncbi:helix-turn-helix domain-containing protein [Nocardioides sp.]|uniref:helix-turn-helix domain-containing protein n=1 Tax=Nocardioides sp. TaxID=35761 RepID=UPI003519614D